MEMELRIGDRRITNSDDFPEHVTPFPVTTDLVYEHPTTAVVSSPPEIKEDSSTYFPPQKLRPIRSNGKNPLEYADSPMNTLQPGELLVDGGLSVNNYLLAAAAAASAPPSEVGFLGNQLRELCHDAPSVGAGQYLTKCGSVAGNGFWTAETMTAMQEVFGNAKSKGGVLETETSSSSDYSGNSSENIPVNRKRKRRTKKKLEMFVENLAAKLMQRQEQMHNELIQIIETKEKDRILREEAWKQQEMERSKREEEVRAQETSRNLAIVSFIQNILGNGFEGLKPLRTSCRGKEEGEVHNQSIVKYDQTDERLAKFESHSKHDTNDRTWSETEAQTRYDLFSKRWPKAEVQALIAVRTALDHKFLSMGSKGSIWEEISVGLASMGYNRTAKKCKEKWENMNKYFKKTMDGGKMRPENAKTCPYFQELEILYKAGLKNPASSLNNSNDENEDESARA